RVELRESPARGVERLAARGDDPDHGERSGQADRDADRAAFPGARLPRVGDEWYGQVPARAWRPGDAGVQGARRTAQLSRLRRPRARGERRQPRSLRPRPHSFTNPAMSTRAPSWAREPRSGISAT